MVQLLILDQEHKSDVVTLVVEVVEVVVRLAKLIEEHQVVVEEEELVFHLEMVDLVEQ